MTRIWTPRGAADRFDREVDAVVDPSLGPGTPLRSLPDRDELMALIAAIRDLPEVAPRPAHVADLRARLMAEADLLAAARATVVSAAPSPAVDESRLRLRPPAPSSRRRRRTTVVVGTLTALGVSATVGVAAQTALPGESLYGVKRALETARTQVALSQPARGTLLLDHATDRLAETVAVLDGGDLEGTAALPSTLDSFSVEATEASDVLLAEYERTGDRSLVEELRTFTAASSASLTDMRERMPELGEPAWRRATEAVAAIDTDALTACPLCSADLDRLSFALPATPDFGAPRADAGDEAPDREPSTATDGEGGDDDGTPTPGRGDQGGVSGENRGGRDPGTNPADPDVPDTPDTPGTPAPDDPDSGGLGIDRPLGSVGEGLERGLLGGGQGDGDRRNGGKGGKGGKGGGLGGLDLGGLDDLIP